MWKGVVVWEILQYISALLTMKAKKNMQASAEKVSKGNFFHPNIGTFQEAVQTMRIRTVTTRQQQLCGYPLNSKRS